VKNSVIDFAMQVRQVSKVSASSGNQIPASAT